MALWSAALFGHYKPRYYLRRKDSGLMVADFVEPPQDGTWDSDALYLYSVQGWQKRAEPGDIIAVRPLSEQYRWTETEKREFLIVMLDDFEIEQLPAVVEPYWDTQSYPVYTAEDVAELKRRGETVQLEPREMIKKRRYHVALNDLQDIGVDLIKMLDKSVVYAPKLDAIKKIHCSDKLNKRKALLTDGFNILAPKRIGKEGD